MAQKNKILLHACCAVCLGYSAEKLKEMDYDFVVFFFNPNIYPVAEYERRKQELIKFCSQKNYELIIEEEPFENWRNFVKGYENEREKGQRCNLCFEYRLKRTAQKAHEIGIDRITTTLSISPHKISKNIFTAGKKACESLPVKFIEIDFKKENGFLKTNKIAQEYGLYRQQYCGCEYSVRKNYTKE